MINIQECMAKYDDIQLIANDSLNLHKKYLYVLRKDGHYDIIYKTNCVDFNIQQLKDSDQEFIRKYKQ